MSVRRNTMIAFASFVGLVLIAANVKVSTGEEIDPFPATTTVNGHSVPDHNKIPLSMFLLLREHHQGAQPIFTTPSRRAEWDLMTEVFTCPSMHDFNGNTR